MEASAAGNRAKDLKRNSGNKAWKRIPLTGLGITFLVLLVVKVLLSFFYLQSDSVSFNTVPLALAEDKKSQSESAKMEEHAALSGRLKKKEKTLKAKEMDLKNREEELVPLKKEIDTKLSELNELQASLTAYAKKLADREKAFKDSRNDHLVSLYTAMEPAKAAAIMDKLGISTVALILRHMKGKVAGQIVASMNPERGAQVIEKLTEID